MSLRDRINNPDRRTSDVQPLVERREQPERRSIPRWIERKNEQGLPPKEMTFGAAA